MKASETRDLTLEQRAKLAAALVVIRDAQTLRGWSQYRHGDTVRLLKHVKGKLAQVYNISGPPSWTSTKTDD